jgi:4-aminobutyrate--pyruvate transaminase
MTASTSSHPITNPNSLHARDIAYTLHPYTNARRHEQIGPLIIERGEGIYVVDDSGNRYIEGMAGLWNAALGFNDARLIEAGVKQLRAQPYYHNFNHRAHPAAIEYAERLVKIAPQGLEKVFFANSGSEANDTVIKLVRYFNNALGRRSKKKIISRARAYHGITIGSGSLTGLPLNHEDFDLPIEGILHTACPHHYRYAEANESEEAYATRLAAELEALILKEGPDTVAAFIGEPIMGAGGVIVPPRTYWEKVQDVCRRHDVLVAVDEVICGFGRTGDMFACETFNIEPDLLVLSKQITSGYQPLSAVLMTGRIYNVVADNSNRLTSFGHGFTTGSHPVAMAVALESLNVYEERNIIGHVRDIAGLFQERLRAFADHPLVGEVRCCGLIGAVEFVADKATKAAFAPPGALGSHLMQRALANGLIARQVGDGFAFAPPLIITDSQINDMFDRFRLALDETYKWHLDAK